MLLLCYASRNLCALHLHAHVILPYTIILIIFVEEYKLIGFSPASYYFMANIHFSILLSDTLSVLMKYGDFVKLCTQLYCAVPLLSHSFEMSVVVILGNKNQGRYFSWETCG
jgi:hypothetical protein